MEGVSFSAEQAAAVTDIANSGSRNLMLKSGFDSSLASRLSGQSPNLSNVTELFVEQTGRNGVASHDAAKLQSLQSGAAAGAQHLDALNANKVARATIQGVTLSAGQAAAITDVANSGNRALMEKSGFASDLAAHMSSNKPSVKNVGDLFVNQTGLGGVSELTSSEVTQMKIAAVRGGEHLAALYAGKNAAAKIQGV